MLIIFRVCKYNSSYKSRSSLAMPNYCCIVGCSNSSAKTNIGFFTIPRVIKREGKATEKLLKRRRAAWIRAINRKGFTDKVLSKKPWIKICGDHFVTGRPAYSHSQDNPDWVPTLNLGYSKDAPSIATAVSAKHSTKLLATESDVTDSSSEDNTSNEDDSSTERQPDHVPVAVSNSAELIGDLIMSAECPAQEVMNKLSQGPDKTGGVKYECQTVTAQDAEKFKASGLLWPEMTPSLLSETCSNISRNESQFAVKSEDFNYGEAESNEQEKHVSEHLDKDPDEGCVYKSTVKPVMMFNAADIQALETDWKAITADPNLHKIKTYEHAFIQENRSSGTQSIAEEFCGAVDKQDGLGSEHQTNRKEHLSKVDCPRCHKLACDTSTQSTKSLELKQKEDNVKKSVAEPSSMIISPPYNLTLVPQIKSTPGVSSSCTGERTIAIIEPALKQSLGKSSCTPDLTSSLPARTSENVLKCFTCQQELGSSDTSANHICPNVTSEIDFASSARFEKDISGRELQDQMLEHMFRYLVPHKCEICGARFQRAKDLSDHQILDHSFKCNICNMKFSKESYIAQHKKYVHASLFKKTSFVCKVCSREFKKYTNLITHMNVHEELKRFFCEVCGKGFAYKGQLSSHMWRHRDEKRFQCEKCGKAFKHSVSFQKHRRGHLGIKPYTCEICGKKLASKEGYTSHVQAHKGPPPFQCDLCDKGYYTPFNLRNHKKDKHKAREGKSS